MESGHETATDQSFVVESLHREVCELQDRFKAQHDFYTSNQDRLEALLSSREQELDTLRFKLRRQTDGMDEASRLVDVSTQRPRESAAVASRLQEEVVRANTLQARLEEVERSRQTDAREADRVVAGLRESLEQVTAEARRRVADLDGTVETYRTEMRDKELENLRLMEVNDRLQREAHRADAERVEMAGRAEQERGDMGSAIIDLKSQLAMAHTALQTLQGDQQDMVADLKATRIDRDEADTRAAEYGGLLTQLQTQIETVPQLIDEARRAAAAEARAELQGLTTTLAQAQRDNAELGRRNADLVNTLHGTPVGLSRLSVGPGASYGIGSRLGSTHTPTRPEEVEELRKTVEARDAEIVELKAAKAGLERAVVEARDDQAGLVLKLQSKLQTAVEEVDREATLRQGWERRALAAEAGQGMGGPTGEVKMPQPVAITPAQAPAPAPVPVNVAAPSPASALGSAGLPADIAQLVASLVRQHLGQGAG